MATHPDMDKWTRLAEKELRGASIDTLSRTTPEDIIIKPLYTSADISDLRICRHTPRF
jgi:methylmalonyl-CoA mutase